MPTVVPSNEVVIDWLLKSPNFVSFIFLTNIDTKFNGDMVGLGIGTGVPTPPGECL
jgi:hypothetical protein